MPFPNGYSEATVANAFNPRHLELILLPTEKCNFRCTYCYESFAIGRMQPKTILGIERFIERRAASLDSLAVTWFGGEPLLEQNIVFRLLEHANAISKSHNISFGSGFTTNGYFLTPTLLEKLSKLNATNFQITLDGDEEVHNSSRILANGRGTFERIWTNLLAAKGLSIYFHITLRIHISSNNHRDLPVFMEKIKSTFGDDSRFSLHFHKVTDLGGINKTERSFLSDADYAAALNSAMSSTTLKAGSEIQLKESREICYAAKPNSLLIRANGRLGKCTVAFEDPRNDIGSILEDGTIDIDNEKLRLWMDGYIDFDPETLSCPLSTLGRRGRKVPVDIEVLA